MAVRLMASTLGIHMVCCRYADALCSMHFTLKLVQLMHAVLLQSSALSRHQTLPLIDIAASSARLSGCLCTSLACLSRVKLDAEVLIAMTTKMSKGRVV